MYILLVYDVLSPDEHIIMNPAKMQVCIQVDNQAGVIVCAVVWRLEEDAKAVDRVNGWYKRVEYMVFCINRTASHLRLGVCLLRLWRRVWCRHWIVSQSHLQSALDCCFVALEQ